MTFTIEPMITVGAWEHDIWDDGWTAVTADRRRTAQFEHTLVVTDDGVEILTERNGPPEERLCEGGGGGGACGPDFPEETTERSPFMRLPSHSGRRAPSCPPPSSPFQRLRRRLRHAVAVLDGGRGRPAP